MPGSFTEPAVSYVNSILRRDFANYVFSQNMLARWFCGKEHACTNGATWSNLSSVLRSRKHCEWRGSSIRQQLTISISINLFINPARRLCASWFLAPLCVTIFGFVVEVCSFSSNINSSGSLPASFSVVFSIFAFFLRLVSADHFFFLLRRFGVRFSSIFAAFRAVPSPTHGSWNNSPWYALKRRLISSFEGTYSAEHPSVVLSPSTLLLNEPLLAGLGWRATFRNRPFSCLTGLTFHFSICPLRDNQNEKS